jgi:hypothetical protein
MASPDCTVDDISQGWTGDPVVSVSNKKDGVFSQFILPATATTGNEYSAFAFSLDIH